MLVAKVLANKLHAAETEEYGHPNESPFLPNDKRKSYPFVIRDLGQEYVKFQWDW